jgi:hypothetical protein
MKSDRYYRDRVYGTADLFMDVCPASPQSWELLAATSCGLTNVELCIKPPDVDFYSGRLAKESI